MKIYQQNETCRNHSIKTSSLSESTKQLTITITYDLNVKSLSTTVKEFDENFVFIDEIDKKKVTTEILRNTGCADEICKTNLELIGKVLDIDNVITVGIETTFRIQYSISNSGEAAYRTKLKITTKKYVAFAAVSSSCSVDTDDDYSIMECDIRSGKPITDKNPYHTNITFDISNMRGGNLEIIAEVSTMGDDSKSTTNKKVHQIKHVELSEVDVKG
jgi:hypothetical protein